MRALPFANEQAWLLDVLRCSGDAEDRPVGDALHTAALDWAYIQRQARLQRVAGLIYHNCFVVSRSSAVVMPTATQQAFRETYQQNALRYGVLQQQFDEILTLWQTAGIVPVVLKGFWLAQWVYRQPGARPMQDIDVLLNADHLEPAARILATLGYVTILQRLTYLSAWHQALEVGAFAALREQGEHWPMLSKRIGAFDVRIELHHHLTPTLQRPDVETCLLPDTHGRLCALTAEYALLHLCVHLAKHARQPDFPCLLWYADLVHYLAVVRNILDWPRFLKICEQTRLADEIFPILRNVQALWALALPGDLPDGARVPVVARASFFPEIAPTYEARLFFTTIFRAGGWVGLRYLWECIFPSPAFLRQRYHVPENRSVVWWYFIRLSRAGRRGWSWGRLWAAEEWTKWRLKNS